MKNNVQNASTSPNGKAVKKTPWGILGGSCAIATFFLTIAIVLIYVIFSGIAAQTNETTTIFETWWQTLLFVLDVVAVCGFAFAMFMWIKGRLSTKSDSFTVKSIFKRSVWVLLSVFFIIVFLVFTLGEGVALQYEAQINMAFDIEPFKKVDISDDESIDAEYFKSDFYKEDGKTYDDFAMRKHSLAVAKQVAVEGSVLLWNNNNALPLAQSSKISLFGVGSYKWVTGGNGSGRVAIPANQLKGALQEEGFSVNPSLWNKYLSLQQSYGWERFDVENADPNYTDINYVEYVVREVPWNLIQENVNSSIAKYNDAAIMVISRSGGECGDVEVTYKNNECLDNVYLDLSYEENEILTKLSEMKDAGKISKLIVLLNTANPLQMKNLSKFDKIDACMWVGQGGNSGFEAVAELLSGKQAPSGHLSDTYAYDHDSAPATENFGKFTFTQASGLPSNETYSVNNGYVVYQEGIYVGYRYYETRYEDSVLKRGNATGNSGIYTGESTWDYTKQVKYPFGYGISYTTFSYSDYKVKQVGDNFEVSLKITNTGTTYSAKEVMQVYIQKPYTEYDKTHKIEKAAIELAGFAKTPILAPGKSHVLTVTVEGNQFATYDSYNKKTYILEKGDYYIATGVNAHDALNNVLALKGKTTADGMDYNGNKDLAFKYTVGADNYTKYSTSQKTGYDITNQFDDTDINLYAGTSDQKIIYLSRNDWVGTYPSPVSLSCINSTFIADMQYGKGVVAKEEDKMPLRETVTYVNDSGALEGLKLISLMDYAYEDPIWQDLLNQLTWKDMQRLCTYGAGSLPGAESVHAPGGKAKDGPAGIQYTNPNLGVNMGFPNEIVMASTFNVDLINAAGDAFGMEIMHVGFTMIYGPGANMHRSPYGGRNFEYYSEDSYLASQMFTHQCKGLTDRGIIVCAKHFALNEQEQFRYGVATFANEQTIREIYIKAFEDGIVDGNANAVMSSFNRLGATWAGRHSGLLTEVLRKEWGFTGICETDAGVGTHMLDDLGMYDAIVAGQDLWMTSLNPHVWTEKGGIPTTNPTVVLAIREACHRVLYTQLHSVAMNGVKATTMLIPITPWWQTTIQVCQIVSGVIMGLCVAMAVTSFVIQGNVIAKTKALNLSKKQWITILGIIIAVLLVIALVTGIVLMPAMPAHTCEHKCAICGGCKNADCDDDICEIKCSCVAGNPDETSCRIKCGECGKCTDLRCKEPGCSEKCGKTLTNEFKFEVEDRHVSRQGNIITKNVTVENPVDESRTNEDVTFLGAFTSVEGGHLLYTIDSSKATTANLTISVGMRSNSVSYTDNNLIVINGESFFSSTCVPMMKQGDKEWEVFTLINLGCISLEQGYNTIEITPVGEVSYAYNFDYMLLTVADDVTLSWCDYHVCRNVCQTCNKCTDLNCMDDTCFEKCACDGVVKSVFYSLSDYVESEHFVRNDKGFLGAVTNGKAYAVFKVNATTATTATLKMLVSTQMADGTTFNESMLLYVNGTQQTCTVQMPTGGTWTTFETVTLGDYQLVAGTNTIRIEMHATEPGTKTCNIKAIRLDCDQQILWDGYVNHACMSTCPVCSGCKDAECQDPACAIKCICIKSTLDVMDVDAEIIIESGELNPAKGQIGGTSSNTLLTFKVMVDKAGDYAIFANIGSFGSKTVASRLAITANGTALTMSTDSYGLGYEVYQDVYLATATLVEGENVIVWDYLDDAINFRSMTLIGVGNVQWNHSCASACSVCGGCGDENCTSQICATKCKCIFSTLSVTATGTTVGFVGYGSLNYSAGRTGGTAKGTVVLVNVWADKADNTLLTIPVSQGSGSAVNSLDAFSVKVNGVNHSIPADCNVSVVSDWSAWTDVSFGVLALEEGLNTIEFTLLNTGFNFQKFVFNAIGGAKITYPTSNMMVSADDANYAITGSGSYDATNLRIEQTNTGTQVAFNVTSDKQGQVDLYLIIGKAVNNVAFGSCLAVDVNGVEFDTTGVAFSSGADAYTWIKVGTISLNEGANTITFENLDGYVNYYGISLVGAGVNVSWTAK